MNIDRIPPQAIELEESVLGAILLESDSLNKVYKLLSPKCFYSKKNSIIYQTILDLYDKKRDIDILTVTDWLNSIGQLENVGGAVYISSLTNKVVTACNIESHTYILVQRYVQRKMISFMNECIEMAYDNSIDIDDTIGNLYNGLENVNKFFKRNQRTKNWKDLVDISKENARERERKSQQGLILGVPTPLTKLNKVTNGWANTNLIIIAGRTSCGKTSFALQSCRVASFENNIPSGIISLEQSAEELTDRLVCSEGNIESNKYNRGQLTEYDWKSIDKTKEKIENAPLYIDDRSFNLNDIKLKIKEWVSKGVRLVIIDYLQLVRLKNKEKGMTRESEVSTISRELKLTAKEMNIPIIALSQINRGIEQRRNDDKRPKLSDLRESGSIEQDADMVIFSHIPHKMGIKTIGDNEDSKNRGELIIAKFRNGPICIIEFMHNDDFTQFNDIFKDTAEKTEDNVEQKLDF